MNFLYNQCLYQTILLSACMQKDPEMIFTQLTNLYALDNKEQTSLDKVLNNNTFKALTSSDAVVLHQNYLLSFSSNENDFGRRQSEWSALGIKQKAYTTFDDLASDTGGFYDSIVAVSNKSDKLTVTLALLYFLNGASTDVVLALLRRAEGHGNAEAAILLMYFEKDRRYALYEKLNANRELLLYNDNTLEVLKNQYNIEIKEIRKYD